MCFAYRNSEKSAGLLKPWDWPVIIIFRQEPLLHFVSCHPMKKHPFQGWGVGILDILEKFNLSEKLTT